MRKEAGSWKKRWKVSLGREEEVREKWGLQVARTTTDEKGLVLAWWLASRQAQGVGTGLLW